MAPGDGVGVQAGLAMGVPLALFTLDGRQSDGLIASLGAFTALYFASRHRGDRLYALPSIGVRFILAATLGVLLSQHGWLMVAGLCLSALLSTILSFRLGIGPPGPMMFVLAITGWYLHRRNRSPATTKRAHPSDVSPGNRE